MRAAVGPLYHLVASGAALPSSVCSQTKNLSILSELGTGLTCMTLLFACGASGLRASGTLCDTLNEAIWYDEPCASSVGTIRAVMSPALDVSQFCIAPKLIANET